MSKIIPISAYFLLLINSSFAADVVSLDPIASSTVIRGAQSFDWSGLHVGVQGGYVGSDASAELTSVGGLLLEADVANGTLPLSVSGHSRAALLGVQAGYDTQFGQFVLGIAGDIAWTDADGSAEFRAIDPGTPFGPPVFAGQETITSFRSSLDHLATVRVRAGVATDRALFYATGGLAAGHAGNGFEIGLPGLGMGFGPWSESGPLLGYTTGFGVEYAIKDKTTVKIEYLYYDLSDRDVRATDSAFPGQHITYRFLNNGILIRGGLNFRF